MKSHENIGVVGTGRMGAGLARSLRRGGHSVVFLRRSESPTQDALIAEGCVAAATIADVVRDAEIVFLCVPSSVEVDSIMNDASKQLMTGTIIVDCSTSRPDRTVELAGEFADRQIEFFDCPLGRTPPDIWDGKASALTSCPDHLWPRMQPVLSCFAEDISRSAGVGSAHRLKLINNLLSLGQAALAASVVRAASQAGVDLDELDRFVNAGGATSAQFRALSDIARNGGTGLEFAISLAAKDVTYALKWATSAGVDLGPVPEAVLTELTEASAELGGAALLPDLLKVSVQ